VDAASTDAPLYSIGGILLLTYTLVALLKHFTGLTGKATLGVALGVAVALVLLAIYGTGTLDADPITAVVVVLVSVAGAAGVDTSAGALFKRSAGGTSKLPAVGLALLLGSLLLSGCAHDAAFISASRAKHEQVDRFWAEGIDANPELTPDQRATLLDVHHNYGDLLTEKEQAAGLRP
jgi:hypothetical protein